MPSLILISEDKKREVFPLGKATLMIGRDNESEIRLPDSSVSRNHASIVYDQSKKFVIRDNGSTNGTFVNGERIRKHELKHRDMVRFGDYVFLVDMEDSELKEATANETRNLNGVTAEITPPSMPPVEPIAPISKKPSHYASVVNLKPRPIPVGVAPRQSTAYAQGGLRLMLTAPVPRPSTHASYMRHAQRVSPSRNILMASMICGCMGFVAFLPAIILGHAAHPFDERDRHYRRVGLMLGYIFLIAWLGVGVFFWKKPPNDAVQNMAVAAKVLSDAKTLPQDRPQVPLLIPSVPDAMQLLQGTIAWVPFPEALSAIQSDSNQMGILRLPPSHVQDDLLRAVTAYRQNWRQGVVVFEPEFLRIDNSPNAENKVRFIIEDCFSFPNFKSAGWEYNSTVVPEKKPLINPFYLPNVGDLYFGRNSLFAARIPKFNKDNIPWRMAERGVQWTLTGLPPAVQESSHRLRWVVFLKPTAARSSLSIATIEGDLLRDYDKSYAYDIYPAEVLAEAIYVDGSDHAAAIRLNEGVYLPGDAPKAIELIEANFKTIMSTRPFDRLEVPAVFKLTSVDELKKKAAVKK